MRLTVEQIGDQQLTGKYVDCSGMEWTGKAVANSMKGDTILANVTITNVDPRDLVSYHGGQMHRTKNVSMRNTSKGGATVMIEYTHAGAGTGFAATFRDFATLAEGIEYMITYIELNMPDEVSEKWINQLFTA